MGWANQWIQTKAKYLRAYLIDLIQEIWQPIQEMGISAIYGRLPDNPGELEYIGCWCVPKLQINFWLSINLCLNCCHWKVHRGAVSNIVGMGNLLILCGSGKWKLWCRIFYTLCTDLAVIYFYKFHQIGLNVKQVLKSLHMTLTEVELGLSWLFHKNLAHYNFIKGNLTESS